MSISEKQSRLLSVLRKQPNQTADGSALLEHLPGWSLEDIMTHINPLSGNYVDFVTIKGRLFFKAANIEEVQKTGSMSDTERIVYQLIKSSKNKGIWIKDIKAKSGLHTQLVNTNVKNLEKKMLIKSVKSVKTPTKKVYMLYDVEPSVELTGGAWYTDQELDVEFIDQLSNQLYRYILSKSFPVHKPKAIYSALYDAYPTLYFLHKWIRKSGITSVELALSDVSCLLDRLVFDGKIVKIPKMTASVSDQHNTDSEWDGDEQIVGDFEATSWMYKAVKDPKDERNPWTDIPCGKCPVFEFCKDGGPVSPSSCVYFKKWLADF